MTGDRGSVVHVWLGGLDDTTARSVRVFLEVRHSDHFAVTGLDEAEVLMVDLDRPDAAASLGAARDEQVVLGVGFSDDPAPGEWRRYLQKPLTGESLMAALDDALTLVGTRRPVVEPSRLDRGHRARDLFAPPRPQAESPSTGERRSYPAPRTYEAPQARTREAPRWDAERPSRQAPAAFATPAGRPSPALPVAPAVPVGRSSVRRLAEESAGHHTTGTAAEALGRRTEVEPVEARDGGDLRDPGVLASYTYSPAAHLDGLVRKVAAQHHGTLWELRGPTVTLVGDPLDDTVLASVSATRLRQYCGSPLGDGWQVVARPRRPDTTGLRRVQREVLLWDTAVWSSAGRLADTVDPFAVTGLRAWPDMTRGVLTPSALPIVALLAACPQRPVDVAEKLGISRTHVFVVVSALEALGLLEPLGAAGVATEVPVPPRAETRGLLRRLLGRLR